jgi:hypothetical protein
MQDRHNTAELLSTIQKQAFQLGSRGLFVFDLDSTLFDVSPRLERILMDYAALPEHQTRFPESCEILKNIRMLRSDWGIKNALIRAGLDDHHAEFHDSIKAFWKKTFFSSEYLHYDIPYEGAVEFVQKVAGFGCEIAYLTGRDVHRMGRGSDEVLRKWSFPLSIPKAQLVLKPQAGMDDAEFKTNWFRAIPYEAYDKIWFFENEPVNVNRVAQHLDHIEIVFFHSTHSGQQEAPENIPRIVNYLLK